MTDALWSLSATEIANGVRTHQFTAVSAVEATLDRMAAVNSKINAVTIDNSEMALMAARKAAVSYTHNRAHETSLQLECRLQLEKK